MNPSPVSDDVRPYSWWYNNINEIGLVLALLVLVVVFSQTAPNFFSERNLVNILRSASYVGILAFPMTLVIIAGEIDISIGPAVAFLGVAFAHIVSSGDVPAPLGLLIVLVGGAFFGSVAGWLRVRYSVPTFISTLAMWSAMRGGALWWTDALPILIPQSGLRSFLSGDLLVVPVVAWIMFATFLCFSYLAQFSRYGRHIYALGANPAAVQALGINSGRLRVLVMATTGAFAGLVGVLIDARLGSGNANAATGLEFDVIAAVIVGGTLLTGGHGRMIGTLLGVFVIAVLANGLVLVGVDPDVQQVVRGLIILIAVLINGAIVIRAKRSKAI